MVESNPDSSSGILDSKLEGEWNKLANK